MTDADVTDVDIVLEEGLRFVATNRVGATDTLDVADQSGHAAGMSPMEFLLAGLGGCTAIDVIGILRKKRLTVTDYRLEVRGTKAPSHPRVFTDISVKHIVTGPDIPEEAVRHAVELSEAKYCSAYAMLSKAAAISSAVEVRTPAQTSS